MTAITQYYAKVGIATDMAQLKKVDRYLSAVESKIRAWQRNLNKKGGALNINFVFNTNRLQFEVQRAFSEVGRRVRFPVENFVINRQNLSNQISGAIRQAVSSANKNLTLNPRVNKVSGPAGGGGVSGRSASSASRANFLHAGGAGGALARYGAGALPFVGGVYGLGSLNTANQEMMSANIAAQSVLGPNANQSIAWLKAQADFLGVNYAQTLPQFTKFMASASPLLGNQQSQDVFQSFMQFGRTRGATDVSMNRALNAVAQMGAKGQIMQEELKGQLAEASGFGELPQLFAEAYQIQSGGNLTGPKARAALMKAMENSLVKSDILPIVSQLMNELSKGGIEQARTSSIAQQARAQNQQRFMLESFSRAGGEAGFARMWRTAADVMREMDRSMPRMGEFFDKGTEFLRQIILLPQSVGRMFEGRDSTFQKWLFGEGESGEKIMTVFFNIKETLAGFADLGKIAYDGWSQLFGFLKEQGFIDTLLDKMISLQRSLLLVIEAVKTAAEGDLSGAFSKMRDATVLAAPDMVAGALLGFKSESEVQAERQRILNPFVQEEERRNAVRNPDSIYYNDPKGYDTMVRERAAAEAMDKKMYSEGATVTFGDINVQLPPDAAGAADAQRAQMFANMLQNAINEALPNFNINQ